MATRAVRLVFSSNVAVTESFPVPEGVMVHQPASDERVHPVFDSTKNFVVPAALATLRFGGVSARVTGTPDWVTVTICGETPVPVTVSVATRVSTVVFSS